MSQGPQPVDSPKIDPVQDWAASQPTHAQRCICLPMETVVESPRRVYGAQQLGSSRRNQAAQGAPAGRARMSDGKTWLGPLSWPVG